MRVRLGETWRRKLSKLPETAMGSQRVDIFLTNGSILRDVPVFNGEHCETEQPFDPAQIKDIQLHPPDFGHPH